MVEITRPKMVGLATTKTDVATIIGVKIATLVASTRFSPAASTIVATFVVGIATRDVVAIGVTFGTS